VTKSRERRRATGAPIAIPATVVLMASIAAACGQQVAATDKIVGNWKLLSFYDQNVDTGNTTDVLGENPRGYLLMTADGRIALIHVANSRKAPQSLPAAEMEAAELFRTMLAYVGRYEIDQTPDPAGLKVTIRSEVASNPLLEGRDRKFVVRIEGDKLTFQTTPPARNPLSGEMTTRNVILVREL
jgi:hypothetical protein